MSVRKQLEEENSSVRERYDLAMNRIEEMFNEGLLLEDKRLHDYFVVTAAFLLSIKETVSLVEKGLDRLTTDALRQLNQGLYSYIRENCPREEEFGQECPDQCIIKGDPWDFRKDGGVLGMCYKRSYANPSYAVKQIGEEYGSILSFLFAELQSLIPCAFEQRLFDITILLELFLEIFHCFQTEEEPLEGVKAAIYYHFKDYCNIHREKRIQEQLDPSLDFALQIIENENLFNLRYLYYYGEPITEQELAIAEFFSGLPEEEIESMARTFTGGFQRGFLENQIDLGKKAFVNIRYSIGFERMVKAAVRQFGELGLKPVLYRASLTSPNRRQHMLIGYYAEGINRQFIYDHRFDDGLYLTKTYLERKLMASRKAYEAFKDLAAGFAGPAVIETFGQDPFQPEDKKEAIKYTEKQQKLMVWYENQIGLLTNEFIKKEEHSFTIIAYPIPAIGPGFEQIFRDTIQVNNLDNQQYEEIQKTLIDALDKGEYVYVKGGRGNRTDLKIMLHKMENPKKESNFVNCTASVNIPVGEVFTSPMLTGTEGVLHVPQVYLRGLKYEDLEIRIQGGKTVDYSCKNFPTEEENQRYIRENLLYQHESLPLGEFAIGTNTTAYVMAKNYGISALLPTLIAEKTGPHFALGDTCFRMSEDIKTYNPDGKEITAKDNECSMSRKTDREKAYFNCHTDITIPYEELEEITVYGSDGWSEEVIRNGRFVLPGTEDLNKAFDGLKVFDR